ncbi:MAG: hypothetical protein EXQ85_00230 [Alphaproteobacteria bacterium]|nr:hypothetical protein [Alphaproteobacteria bacterium]
MRVEWPAGLALRDGTYPLHLGNAIRAERLDLRVAPAQPTPSHLVAWLADNGCGPKARRLLQTLVEAP